MIGPMRVIAQDHVSPAPPPSGPEISVFIVPLVTEDWHHGYDLEIGERGDPDSLFIDNLPDSAVERIRAYMKMLDTRQMHTEYNLNTGTKAWAEYGTPQQATNADAVSRILAGLAYFDTAGVPDTFDSAHVAWLQQGFPALPDEIKPIYCGLSYHDFDGIPPADAMVFLHSGGSAGCYALYVAVRTPTKVTFQELDGCSRGLRNMLYRAEGRDSLFWFTSGYNDSTLVVDGRIIPFVQLNNNVWWPGSTGIMTEISDLPVPYFWDGEKMAWNPDLAQHFYARLSGALGLLSEADSVAIAYSIGTLFR